MDSLDSAFFSQSTMPQTPVVEVEYAGFFRRFIAVFIDSIITGVVISLINRAITSAMAPNITQAITASGFSPENPTFPMEFFALFGDVLVISMLISFILNWLYFAGFESSSMMATPGKRVMGMSVVDEDGDQVSFGTATGRYLGKMISSILYIGYLMALFTSKKQALHDKIAGTFVTLRPRNY